MSRLGVTCCSSHRSSLRALAPPPSTNEGREDETGVEVLKAQNLHASHHGSRTFVKDAKDDPEPYLEAFELIDSEDVIISVGPTRNTTTRTRTCSISTTIRSAQRTCRRRASREFARANPALYEAMFTLPLDLTFARSNPVLYAGFVEIRTALAPMAGDVDTFTE